METNTLITNNVGYIGSVKITYRYKNTSHSIRIKNEGTSSLGDLISIALSGDQRNINTISSRCPNSIGFEFRLNSTSEYRQLLSNNAPITSSIWGASVNDIENSTFSGNSNVIGKNRFSAIISTGLSIPGFSSSLSSADTIRLKLVNSRGESLAYISEYSTTEEKSLPLLYTALVNGQDALIEWTMYILNYTNQ